MRFRRSRVVILAVILILVSSVGYWLTYVTSRPQADLSELHSYVDNVDVRRGHSNMLSEPQRSVKESHGDADSHRNDDRNNFQRKEVGVADGHEGIKRLGAQHRAGKVDGDDKDEYNEEDTVDGAHGGIQHDRGHTGQHKDNALPAAAAAAGPDDDNDDRDYIDDYDARRAGNLPNVDDAQRPVKNVGKVSDNGRDYRVVSELQSQRGQRVEEIEDVGDGNEGKKQHGDEQRAFMLEQRRKHDGDTKQRDSELEEVNIGGLGIQSQKSERDKERGQRDKEREQKDKERDQRDEVWRLQQLNDGARASHVRSHNIAPVPRVPGNSLPETIDSQKLNPPVNKAASELDAVIDSIDGESPHRDDMHDSSSNYFIVHSSLSSRANGAMHPSLHALPGHVEPEAYIFTSNRSGVFAWCVCSVQTV